MKIIWTYRVYVDAKNHVTTWRETYLHLSKQHDITYIFPYRNQPECFAPKAELIKKKQLPGLALTHYLIASWNALRKLDRKTQPDLVILDYWTAFHSLIYLFRKKRPFILVDFRDPKHNDDGQRVSLFHKLYSKWVLALSARFHDGIAYISDGLRRQMENDFDKVNPNYLIWPSGVDADTFYPIPKAFDPNAPLSIFFHGSVTANRGLGEVIDALPILKKQNVPCVLTILGDGDYLNTLKQQVIRLQVDDMVVFKTPEDYKKMPAYIAQADICAMAYPAGGFWEGNVPLKLLEYMAMEKVVLCSELQVFKDISQGKNFILFIQDNAPVKIAKALEYAWQHKSELAEWGKDGREVVLKEYTWESISAHMHDFFTREVAKKKQLAS